jgi:hypothetical protein
MQGRRRRWRLFQVRRKEEGGGREAGGRQEGGGRKEGRVGAGGKEGGRKGGSDSTRQQLVKGLLLHAG